MKKFFIFIVGLILGFVFFVFLSSWVKALPTDEETTPTVTEVKPVDEPTVVEEIEVVEAVDYEKFEDEDDCFTSEGKNVDPKEKNIVWVTAKVVIDCKGNLYVGFEGETVIAIKNISFDYRLFTSDNKYIPLKNGYDNITDGVGQGVDNKKYFCIKMRSIPDASINVNDIDKVVGIEICNIDVKYINDNNGEYDQTGYQKRFYNVERVK